ncbi:MAG: GNAT family N-acetyltransferase [Acidobacteria bacterium]|nr:GNAT family N-acetyltransferase [Acidobacteriota bacterium]
MQSYWQHNDKVRPAWEDTSASAPAANVIEIDARVVTPSVARASFDIASATEVPAAALTQFYERMYPARAAFLAAHWRWLYRIGAHDGATGPLVALDGETVIGHIGAIPMCLRAGEDTRPAVWDLDFAVLPEYQGRKVGTQLMRVQREQYPLHVAFGNEKSAGAVTKIGWQLSQETHSFQLLLRPECHPQFRHSKLAVVGQSCGWITRRLWAARANQGSDLIVSPATVTELARFAQPPSDPALHVARSTKFLHWRVLQHPQATEHCVLRFPVNAMTEYALLARRSEQDGFRRLHLLSLMAEPFDANALARCFASVVRWCLSEDIHRVLFVTSRPAIARVARTWFPLKRSLRFLAYAEDEAGWRYLTAHPHHWECLDSDFDLAV